MTRAAKANRAWPTAPLSRGVGTDGRTRAATIRTTSTTATTATNDPRQPTACPSNVPTGRPSALADAKPVMTTAIARPARSGGTIEVAVTIAAAMNSPCAAPMTTRAARNIG